MTIDTASTPLALHHVSRRFRRGSQTTSEMLVAIDQTGRLQLPPELRERFPRSTAQLAWDDGDWQMTARPR